MPPDKERLLATLSLQRHTCQQSNCKAQPLSSGATTGATAGDYDSQGRKSRTPIGCNRRESNEKHADEKPAQRTAAKEAEHLFGCYDCMRIQNVNI